MITTLSQASVSPGRGLLTPHGYLHPSKSEHSEVQSPSIIAGASGCFKGGPPTDLKNMANRQEWKGQSFINKKTCDKAFFNKKIVSHNIMCFFQSIFFNFFKEMIRIDLFNMENVKYMASLF